MKYNCSSLFFYGTLCNSGVYEVVTEIKPNYIPARLTGWEVVSLREKVYPGIVKNPHTEAVGTLVRDITTKELQALNAFEDTIYENTLVEVVNNKGVKETAQIFALKEEHYDLIGKKPWNYDYFLHYHLSSYLKSSIKWRCRYDSLRMR